MDPAHYVGYAEAEQEHWWHRGRRAVIKAALADLPKLSGRRVLSIGCGTGAELEFLKSYGQVTAVDNSDDALRLARRVPSVDVRFGELPKLDLDDESYDLIFCSEVLEHVRDDGASLEEMQRLLTSSGRAVFTVPAFGSLWSDHDEAAGHFRRYTTGQLQSRAEAAGFTILKITYIDFWLFPLFWVVIKASHWLHFSRSALTFKTPPKPVNAVLYQIFASERWLINRFRLPFGGSVLLIAQKSS